jgi:hypothetical protein
MSLIAKWLIVVQEAHLSLLAAPRLSVPASIVDFGLPFMIAVALACLPLFSPDAN